MENKTSKKPGNRPLLYINLLLVLLLIASIIIFMLLLGPILSHPYIPKTIAILVYAFTICLIFLSSITGMVIFAILSRRK